MTHLLLNLETPVLKQKTKCMWISQAIVYWCHTSSITWNHFLVHACFYWYWTNPPPPPICSSSSPSCHVPWTISARRGRGSPEGRSSTQQKHKWAGGDEWRQACQQARQGDIAQPSSSPSGGKLKGPLCTGPQLRSSQGLSLTLLLVSVRFKGKPHP